jgi:outer membrane protein TolC
MYNFSTYDSFIRRLFLLALGVVAALASMTTVAKAAAIDPEPIATQSPEYKSVTDASDELVADALAANLELDAAAASVQQRLAALDQARARYLPALELSSRYTRASGGRSIDFPVGDLLNPVYATLNQLTGTASFPTIQNQQIDFQRTHEQQSQLELTQALYDARIGAGRAAAAASFDAAEAGRKALAGRIERDMRQAYYRWLGARAQVGIYTETLALANENARVNSSLYANGKITRDLVYRAEADQLEVQQALLEARNGERLAQSYVNLLRNAPFSRELPSASVADPDLARLRDALAPHAAKPELALGDLQDSAVARRAELRQADATALAAAAAERLARAAFQPQLAFALDYGMQGEQYRFNSDERYVLASVVLRFNLFSGGADRAGVAGARAALHAARSARALQEQQVRFQVQQALQDLEAAQATLDTAAKRADAAAAAFRIAGRKRDLGQINQAEFIDARRALTDAQLNLNITRFGALGDLAELQYALGADTRRLP